MSLRKQQERSSAALQQSRFGNIDALEPEELIEPDRKVDDLRASNFSRRTKHNSAVDNVLYKPLPTEQSSQQPTSNSRLKEIQEQKQKLREKLNQLSQSNSTAYVPSSTGQDNITRLMKYKQKVRRLLTKMEEQERASEAAIANLQAQARKKALAKKKDEMERLARERVQLEGDIQNRKTVLDSIEMYTKGLDSKQLLDKALHRDITEGVKADYQQLGAGDIGYAVKNVVHNRGEYDQVISEIESMAKKPAARPNLSELNERRMDIFNKQEKLIRRKIILKEMQAQEPQAWQQLSGMSEDMLDELIEKLGHNVDDYRNPVPRQMLLDQLDRMQQQAEERIKRLKKPQPTAALLSDPSQSIRKCRKQLERMSPDSISMVRQLLNDVVEASCDHYQRLMKRVGQAGTRLEAEQANYQLFKRKEAHQVDLAICTQIADQMLQRLSTETRRQAADEIFKLHELAWQKTFRMLSMNLTEKSEQKILELMNEHSDVTLMYSGAKPAIKFKNQQKANAVADKPDIYDVMRDTRELVSEVELLEKEDEYFQKVATNIKKIDVKVKDITQLLFNSLLLIATNKGIRTLDQRMSHEYPEAGSYRVASSNNFMLAYSSEHILILNITGPVEYFSKHLGDRVGVEAGEVACCCFYPITTILGSVCSLIVAFKSGVLMKYNFNRDPVSEQQTNLAYFEPLLPHLRTGEQPKLPAQHASEVDMKPEKLTSERELHEYREFFKSHHTLPIVSIVFYRPTQFITIDEGLNCGMWTYLESNKNSYEPERKFTVKLDLLGYRYPQNPSIKAVPLTKSPELLYEELLIRDEGLKKQVYVNPKQSEAIYLTSDAKPDSTSNISLWKVVYNSEEQRVTKIYQQLYARKEIRAKAKDAKFWNGNLFILTERLHIIKDDLLTMRVVGWNIAAKRLRPIAYEIDVYQTDKVSTFSIVESIVPGMQLPGVMLINAGRILVFSMITGQLVRIVVDPNSPSKQFDNLVFTQHCSSPHGLAYASNTKQLFHIECQDNNQQAEKHSARKEFDKAAVRYLL